MCTVQPKRPVGGPYLDTTQRATPLNRARPRRPGPAGPPANFPKAMSTQSSEYTRTEAYQVVRTVLADRTLAQYDLRLLLRRLIETCMDRPAAFKALCAARGPEAIPVRDLRAWYAKAARGCHPDGHRYDRRVIHRRTHHLERGVVVQTQTAVPLRRSVMSTATSGMRTITARVFTSGNSQALRLSKAFRIRGRTMEMSTIPGGFMAVDPAEIARRRRALKRLWGSCPDFPKVRT